MAGSYEILNARVKQKIATETQWISEEDTFGVIFEGEQAFVKNDDGTPVNFKIGDGTKKFSELAYFIAYYSNITNQKVLPYLDRTANISIPSVFRVNSYMTDVIFLNNSGDVLTLNIGTTDGGTEIATIDLAVGISCIGLKKYFDSVETIYLTGLTGKSFSAFILYIQLDESPAIPPSSSGGSGNAYNYGTVYAFYPMYSGHEDAVWDFTTGLGLAGTPYSSCMLMGTLTATTDLSDTFLKGYKTGDTLGGIVGSNEVTLITANLPKLKIGLPASSGGTGAGGLSFAFPNNNTVSLDVKDSDGNVPPSSPTPISTIPNSRSVLFFTGQPTT